MMVNTTNNYKVTRKDLLQTGTRWIFGSQLAWNYERMMSTGYLYAMLPFLKKKYNHSDDELQEMLKVHNQFFNTATATGHFILGIDMAIEEKEGIVAKDTVTGIKTGLMGPFAGIGDTITGVLIPTIFGSIAAYMGLEGNISGMILWMMVNLAVLIARLFFTPIGYQQGVKLVNEMSDRLSSLTNSAIILGITVVGAMVPTVINANIPYVFESGEVSLPLQEVFDQIMPALIPALLTGLVYWLLGKEKMSSTKAIFFVMILSIVLYNLQILG